MIKRLACVMFGLGGWGANAMAQSLPDRDCTRILSALERLSCFDQAAGTPASVPAVSVRSVAAGVPAVVALLQANERKRPSEHLGFIMTVDTEDNETSQQRVMISAPAVGAIDPRPYLTISCQSNISRLQLVLGQSIERHSTQVQLLLDERPVSQLRPWRVLDEGRVIDVGRGLPAVDLIKRLDNGSRIKVQSDAPQLHGLVFDAEGLAPLIEEERKACHW